MQWIANYDDGSLLMQYEGALENKYQDIDRSRLTSFSLVDRSGIPVVTVDLDQTKKLIYRRRTMLQMLSGESKVVYLIGWQISGEEPVIAYVTEQSGILVSGAKNNLELLPQER